VYSDYGQSTLCAIYFIYPGPQHSSQFTEKSDSFSIMRSYACVSITFGDERFPEFAHRWFSETESSGPVGAQLLLLLTVKTIKQ